MEKEKKLLQKISTEGNVKQLDRKDMSERVIENAEDNKESNLINILPKDLKDLYIDYGYYLNNVTVAIRDTVSANYNEMRLHTMEMVRKQAALLEDASKEWARIADHLIEDLSKIEPDYKAVLLQRLAENLGSNSTCITKRESDNKSAIK